VPAGEEQRLWLYGVARRLLAEHHRSAWKRVDAEGGAGDSPAPDSLPTRSASPARGRRVRAGRAPRAPVASRRAPRGGPTGRGPTRRRAIRPAVHRGGRPVGCCGARWPGTAARCRTATAGPPPGPPACRSVDARRPRRSRRPGRGHPRGSPTASTRSPARRCRQSGRRPRRDAPRTVVVGRSWAAGALASRSHTYMSGSGRSLQRRPRAPPPSQPSGPLPFTRATLTTAKRSRGGIRSTRTASHGTPSAPGRRRSRRSSSAARPHPPRRLGPAAGSCGRAAAS
jgi:hypothetical protein